MVVASFDTSAETLEKLDQLATAISPSVTEYSAATAVPK